MKKTVLVFSVVLVSIIINACGGGGASSSNPSPNPAPPPPTSVYSFGIAGGFGSTASVPLNLYTYDPTAPAATLNLFASGNDTSIPASIEHGRFDSATQQINDIHVRSLFYTKGANFFKVSLLRPGTPTPKQVSSEAQAGQSCNIYNQTISTDYSNPDNTMILYSLPGPDGICYNADDQWKGVTMGMTSNDAPIAAKKVAAELSDPKTGLSQGWLVIEGNTLKQYNRSFTSAVTLLTAANGLVYFDKVQTATGSDLYLGIDGKLYRYNTATNTQSAVLHTFSNGSISQMASDSSGFYFVESTYFSPISNGKIYGVSAQGNAVSRVIYQENSAIEGIILTTNSVVWKTREQSGYALKLVRKDGTSTASTVGTASSWIELFQQGNKLFYNFDNFTNTGPSVSGVINDDGNGKQELTYSRFSGTALSAERSFMSRTPAIKKLFRSEWGANNASVTLRSYDPATNTLLHTLGTFPLPITYSGVYSFNGDVASAYIADYQSTAANPNGENTYDLYTVNSEKENSLERLTKFIQ